MTKERAKELLPVIAGYADGKVVQYKNDKGEWVDCFYQTDISFDITSTSYRLKPEETDASFQCCGNCGCDD